MAKYTCVICTSAKGKGVGIGLFAWDKPWTGDEMPHDGECPQCGSGWGILPTDEVELDDECRDVVSP